MASKNWLAQETKALLTHNDFRIPNSGVVGESRSDREWMSADFTDDMIVYVYFCWRQ